jgi:hypothetical protein
MTTSFLGIPVEGDITKGDKRTPQRPLEDLAPILQAVLDDDGIVRFGWHQYTPYFNDGDPCVFSASGVWAARPEDMDADDPDDTDTDSLDVDYGGHLGSYEGGEWVADPENPPFNKRVGARYVGPDQARFDRCRELSRAIDSGAFDDVLLEAFGDHAEITVTRDGITVEFYSHD